MVKGRRRRREGEREEEEEEAEEAVRQQDPLPDSNVLAALTTS